MLSVHVDYLRQGIATKLFKFCIDNGAVRGFPAFSIDCTSHYACLIAERLDMSCLSVMTYDEYNELVGEKIFVASEPHTKVKSHAKLYESR